MRNDAIPICVAVGVAAVSVAVQLLSRRHPLLEEDAEEEHPLLRYEEITLDGNEDVCDTYRIT